MEKCNDIDKKLKNKVLFAEGFTSQFQEDYIAKGRNV